MSHTMWQQPLTHPGRQAAWWFRVLTPEYPVLRTALVLPHQVPQGWVATGARVQRLGAVLGHAVCAAGPSRNAEAGAAGHDAPLLAPLRGRRPSAAFPPVRKSPRIM